MTKKIPVLNGLRGIAIIGVFYWHLYGDKLRMADWGNDWLLFPYFLLSNSFQGVALFFVLSALVLYLPYVSGERHMNTKDDVWAFYKRRAARLLPLYYLCVLLSMTYMRQPANLEVFLRDVFLMGSGTFVFFESTFMPRYNFVLWTLGIEIWFSVLMPFLIIAARKIGIGRLVACLCALALCARLFGVLCIRYKIYKLFDGATTPVLDHVLCRLDDFAVGMLLAHVFTHRRNLLKSNVYFPIGTACVLGAFAVRSCVKAGVLDIFLLPLVNTLLAAGLFCIIGHVLTRKGVLSRLLSMYPLQLIGLMCYSLYVWHLMAMYAINPRADVFRMFSFFMLVSCLSWMTYRYVENGRVADWRSLLPGRKQHEEPAL